MHRLKKIALWSAGFAGTLLALYLTTLLLLPRFIDSEAVKRKFATSFLKWLAAELISTALNSLFGPFLISPLIRFI